jgi:hypothetical protein
MKKIPATVEKDSIASDLMIHIMTKQHDGRRTTVNRDQDEQQAFPEPHRYNPGRGLH